MPIRIGPDLKGAPDVPRMGTFTKRLSSQDFFEFESLKTAIKCPANTVLFVEEEAPDNALFLSAGQVKLSMNSSPGKRLIFGIANSGEALGLASALSGSRYDFTAETVSPCIIVSLERQDFIEFLMRYPAVFQDAARELSLDFARACEHVRRLGLEVTATAKLARLLLGWCAFGQKKGRGTRFVCALTHREIGECIGSSRETVTRIFTELKCRELLESRGSTLIISNRRALEIYAGVARD